MTTRRHRCWRHCSPPVQHNRHRQPPSQLQQGLLHLRPRWHQPLQLGHGRKRHLPRRPVQWPKSPNSRYNSTQGWRSWSDSWPGVLQPHLGASYDSILSSSSCPWIHIRLSAASKGRQLLPHRLLTHISMPGLAHLAAAAAACRSAAAPTTGRHHKVPAPPLHSLGRTESPH